MLQSKYKKYSGVVKMKILKKYIALLLACVMLLSVTACGKNEPAGSDVAGTTEDISGDNLFDDEPLWEDDEPPSEQSSTTEPSTKKQEDTTKPVQSTTTTTAKIEEPATESEKITIVKSEYTYNSVKQLVYYPNNIKISSKTYPAIVWANGTMCSPDMYDGLLKAIAEGGFIVIANEETMAADGTAQRASIDFIIEQNEDPESTFYKKVNTAKIGVAGHSQGGRSSVNAAAADKRIDCVLSLAGSNYDYEAELLSVPTFFIAGSSDMVVDAGMWIEPAYEICKGPAVYASLKSAIHTRCCTNPSDYSGYIVKWFNVWLKNDSAALNTFKDGGELSKDSKWEDFACKGL